jgi:hypothetical protein
MPRVLWPLHHGRPSIEVDLTRTPGGRPETRTLLADTGAGLAKSQFELLLRDSDCLLCGGTPHGSITLRRAYRGRHPVYRIRVRIPGLGFDADVQAVGISAPPAGFDGNACFPFLKRFTYGNFGDRTQFGLEL